MIERFLIKNNNNKMMEAADTDNYCNREFCNYTDSLPSSTSSSSSSLSSSTSPSSSSSSSTSTTKLTLTTTSFYKFLARFSGRRRTNVLHIFSLTQLVTIIILVYILINSGVADACSSRTTPKPRPPTTTPRPNITFHTYKCPPTYAAWYCLNDARCFTVKIGDSLLYSCECAEGFMGPRCEYKDLDGSYLPTRSRVLLEKASLASGATLALFVVLLLCLVLYVRWQQLQKKQRSNIDIDDDMTSTTTLPTYQHQQQQQQLQHQQHLAPLHSTYINNNNNNPDIINGVDTVDGIDTTSCLYAVRSGPVAPPAAPLRPFGPHHQKCIPMAEAFKR